MVETFVQSTDDVVKFLKDQHNLIKDMFDEVLSASERKAREKAFVELRQLLAVHETAEEMVVHPRVRHEAAKGDEIVDARLEEEHKAKEMLSKLESMDIDSPEFIEELTKFRDAVIDHAEHEENEEFTKLERNLDGRRPRADGQGGTGRGGYRADPPAPGRGVGQGQLHGRPVRVDARPGARRDRRQPSASQGLFARLTRGMCGDPSC